MTTDLIFDFFGTLVRYQDGIFPGERYGRTHQFLLDHGLDLDYDRMVSRFGSACRELEEQARLTLAEWHMYDAGRLFFRELLGSEPDNDLLARFIAVFIEEWNRGTEYFPEIEPFLARLAGRYRLSVISNSQYPPLVPCNLEAMGVSLYFAQVVTSAELGFRRPDQRIFQEALSRLGIKPVQALYIGDSFESDYKGATDAGIPCVLVDPEAAWIGRVAQRVDHTYDLERLLDDIEVPAAKTS